MSLSFAVRASLLAALALTACGGGGGGSSPPPPPTPSNLAPSFTSAAAVSLAENTGAVAYTVAASDPEGASLVFALAGGADAARFIFDPAARTLRFATPPDFEAPADAGADNSYDVRFSVSDGVNTAILDVRITVTNVTGTLSVRRVASGLASPIFIATFPDGSGRMAVVERAGRIRLLDPATGAVSATPLLDIASEVSTAGEQGLHAVAFSPNFATDRSFFIEFNTLAGDTEVRRYSMQTGASQQADPASGDVILFVDQPAGLTNHKGGFLAFDAAGRLLIGLGDGGGSGDPTGAAQNPNTLLGKLIRVDPSSDAFPADPQRDYAIPAGNAFPGGAGGRPEIYALGLRNPFRGSVDAATGDIYIGDVGQGAVEEVDKIAAGATGPINFGWNRREGTQPYNGGADSAAFTAPVAEYFHGSGPREGRSITGGVVYRGAVDALRNRYVFADFITNNIWSIPVSSLSGGTTVPSSAFEIRTQEFAPDAGTLNQIVAFAIDAAGNLWIVGLDGEIFRATASE
jgi:glucose/arabinose dehydrogenase